MLAEFKYGSVPKETFSFLGDQKTPKRLFYHFKKDLFPWSYWNFMVRIPIYAVVDKCLFFLQVKGTWFGTNGPIRPRFPPSAE